MRPGVILFLLGLGPAMAAPSVSLHKNLDTAAIHRIYVDGDFDKATEMLETALAGGTEFSHRDSVFVFKHLGVMYAAKYETREKGKKYMMLLLQVEPTARIMDMYASDMIYMIYKNLQDEYALSQAKLKRAKGHVQGNAQEVPLADVDSAAIRPRSYAWIYWTAGAVAAIGGAVWVVHLATEEDGPVRERIIK